MAEGWGAVEGTRDWGSSQPLHLFWGISSSLQLVLHLDPNSGPVPSSFFPAPVSIHHGPHHGPQTVLLGPSSNHTSTTHGSGLRPGFQKSPGTYPLRKAHNGSSTSVLPEGSLTSGHLSLLWELGWLYLCPGNASESQEHRQEARPVALASRPPGGLWLQHGPVACCRHSLTPPANSLPRIDELFTISRSQAGLADKRGRPRE